MLSVFTTSLERKGREKGRRRKGRRKNKMGGRKERKRGEGRKAGKKKVRLFLHSSLQIRAAANLPTTF